MQEWNYCNFFQTYAHNINSRKNKLIYNRSIELKKKQNRVNLPLFSTQ